MDATVAYKQAALNAIAYLQKLGYSKSYAGSVISKLVDVDTSKPASRLISFYPPPPLKVTSALWLIRQMLVSLSQFRLAFLTLTSFPRTRVSQNMTLVNVRFEAMGYCNRSGNIISTMIQRFISDTQAVQMLKSQPFL
ncbi:hypothetical protein PTI98_009752 [Pleurotus ostreatus]|nr:hypothetical protein PTI98_009752 [Pleurotus ostreatus]